MSSDRQSLLMGCRIGMGIYTVCSGKLMRGVGKGWVLCFGIARSSLGVLMLAETVFQAGKQSV